MTKLKFLSGSIEMPPGIGGVKTAIVADSFTLIEECLNSPPQNGFTFEDFKKRARLDSAIARQKPGSDESSPEFIELEDYDFETLKSCVLQMRWNVRSYFIKDFLDQFQ